MLAFPQVIRRAGLFVPWLALLAQPAWADSSGNHGQKPNVLFICIEDLNDCVGFLGGYQGVQTPNMDRLAERGIVFTQAHCPATICNPSRTAVLTGIRPSDSGIYSNTSPWRKSLPNAVTLPQHFMNHDYHVVSAGKIFHGPEPASWHDSLEHPVDAEPSIKPLHGIPKMGAMDWGPLDIPDEATYDMKVSQWATEYLAQEHKRPFFLAVGLCSTHLPWYAPRKYHELYPEDQIVLPEVKDDDLDDVPPAGWEQPERWSIFRTQIASRRKEKEVLRAYFACVSFVDVCIGKLMKALEESAYAENTIIVVWSDHGYHFGEKQLWGKATLWEESTRVPFIISCPNSNGIDPAACNVPVSLLDIYPTLIELCGLDLRPELHGISLSPLLKQPDMEVRRAVITTHFHSHSVRNARWRYIRHGNGSEELYDHHADPMEFDNLAHDLQYLDVKQQLKVWLPRKNRRPAPQAMTRIEQAWRVFRVAVLLAICLPVALIVLKVWFRRRKNRQAPT